jgi:hypothetical protein
MNVAIGNPFESTSAQQGILSSAEEYPDSFMGKYVPINDSTNVYFVVAGKTQCKTRM